MKLFSYPGEFIADPHGMEMEPSDHDIALSDCTFHAERYCYPVQSELPRQKESAFSLTELVRLREDGSSFDILLYQKADSAAKRSTIAAAIVSAQSYLQIATAVRTVSEMSNERVPRYG
jgi:hypothetical protein